MNRNALLLLSILAWFATPVRAEFLMLEDAVESSKVELFLAAPGQGSVVVRDCQKCPLRFAIDGKTQALLNGKAVPLEEARNRIRRGATVIYDRKTRVVTRISLM
jgi:hypothetical protein